MTHTHRSVLLSVECHDPSDVHKACEVLSRVLAGLGMDGLDVHLSVDTYEVHGVGDDEDEDAKP